MLEDKMVRDVAFRVDASDRIGTGHVMRCLSLARTLADNGIRSHFLCRAHSGHMMKRIKEEGHNLIILPVLIEHQECWLGSSWPSDASETINHLKSINVGWVVVDHFFIDASWEARVKQDLEVCIMVIDGLANRPHNCDLLLDQTYSVEGKKRWKALVPSTCELFVGPKYALFRSEFLKAQVKLGNRRTDVERIFIAFGGVDHVNATHKTLLSLDFGCLRERNITVDVIVGPQNPHINFLKEKYGDLEGLNLYVNPDGIPVLMASADIAIGAGGTMMWERALLQLPTLIISIASNQVPLARSLHAINAAIYVGDIHDISSPMIKNSVNQLVNDDKKRTEIRRVNEKLMLRDGISVSQYLIENL